MPRATVEETVNYMVSMLDDAINSGSLEWAYNGNTGSTNSTNTGHWTKAGAMALKCKILQFAASPLFNDNQGFAGGSSEAERQYGMEAIVPTFGPDVWKLVGSSLMHSIRTGSMN